MLDRRSVQQHAASHEGAQLERRRVAELAAAGHLRGLHGRALGGARRRLVARRREDRAARRELAFQRVSVEDDERREHRLLAGQRELPEHVPAALLERTAMERRRARGQRARRPVRLRQLLVRLQLLDERQLADAIVERELHNGSSPLLYPLSSLLELIYEYSRKQNTQTVKPTTVNI